MKLILPIIIIALYLWLDLLAIPLIAILFLAWIGSLFSEEEPSSFSLAVMLLLLMKSFRKRK